MKSVVRCLGTLALVVTVSLSPRMGRAEPPVVAAEAPVAAPVFSQSPAVSYDTVHLRNGGLYRGRVKEILPGDHVTLAIEGGETKDIPWAEISRIVAGTAASPSSGTSGTSGTEAPPNASATSVGRPLASVRWPDVTPPSEPPAPRTQWRANRPLLVTGAILFATGYGSSAVVALPSTVGFVGRVVVLVLTVGLPCILNSSRDYLCEGHHGAMQLLIPFAGPFLFAGDHPRDTVVNERGAPLSPLAKGLLYTSAGLQLAGIASIIGALATGRQERVPGRASSASSTTTPSFTVAPLSAPGAVGVSVGFSRW